MHAEAFVRSASAETPAGCSGNFIRGRVHQGEAVLLGLLQQVSCPLTTFSPPQRLRDYDALHHKRYGLSIHYHALSLMCDRFGISCFSLRFTSSDVQRRHCEVN